MSSCAEHMGRCWLCAGEMTRGEPVSSWSGSSFTGQNRVRLPAASHVCEACVFVCSRLSPVPGREAKEGRKLGGNFRNYTSIWDERGYVTASKGEKPAIREFFARVHAAPWFAAIADSGQKHVIPWAPMNGAGRAGRVLMDEQIVNVPEDQRLVAEIAQLLTAGATKDEIASGDYGPRAWQLCGDALPGFEATHARERHGGWFSLALWLAQRDEETVQSRLAAEKETRNARRANKKTASRSDGGGAPGDAPRVSRGRGKRAEALGSAAGQDAERGAHDDHARGVVDGDLSVTTPASPAQGELF